jgi:biopolymer transport protein ExbB
MAFSRFSSVLAPLLACFVFVSSIHAAEDERPWWDKKWPTRKQITIDTSAKGLEIKDEIGTSAVLLRLHDGVFAFDLSTEDARDLRFVANDHKTVLKHHVEKWDSLLHEAYVWVQVPDIKPGASQSVWLYYGNVTEAPKAEDAPGTYDVGTTSVYHFGEAATGNKDSSASGVAVEGAGAPIASSMAGGGLRVLGQAPVTIPGAPSNEWAAGSALTWSAWIKPTSLQANATIFSRRDGANSFVIVVDNGVPMVEINKQRSSTGAPVLPAVWHHLAVVVSGNATTLYLDGASYGTLAAGLPAIKGPAFIGKDSLAGSLGLVGEIDELNIATVARPAGFIKFAAASQGVTSDAQKLVVLGNDEATEVPHENELMKHVSLLKDISKDLTPDGWAVIGLCSLLAVVGWGIALGKLLYLNKIGKATAAFLTLWEQTSSDLTALDQEDGEDALALDGKKGVSKKTQKLMRGSPMYHLYHLGCHEIQQRMKNVNQLTLGNTPKVVKGLSGRSIQAIKATLHGGLMREVQKLNGKLVFLTIGIAGGPYLGLLGTVIGVMITFAVIAKSGQVEVNSIAPGIAGALLATVAGLAVAIPALFAYSYLSSRIKDVITDMETFIDEFIAKMAEYYKET